MHIYTYLHDICKGVCAQHAAAVRTSIFLRTHWYVCTCLYKSMYSYENARVRHAAAVRAISAHPLHCKLLSWLCVPAHRHDPFICDMTWLFMCDMARLVHSWPHRSLLFWLSVSAQRLGSFICDMTWLTHMWHGTTHSWHGSFIRDMARLIHNWQDCSWSSWLCVSAQRHDSFICDMTWLIHMWHDMTHSYVTLNDSFICDIEWLLWMWH